MAINVKSVFTSGCVAGLIIGASAIAMVPVVGSQMDEALRARNALPMGVGAMAYFAFVSLVTGIILVWLYAAVRPRFGAGPKTAMMVAVTVWFMSNVLANLANVAYGFMPVGLTMIGIAWGFVELAVAGLVGARLYREEWPGRAHRHGSRKGFGMSRITPNAIVLFGIGVILTAMIAGPFFSPPEFSWLRHSTSEQAGQHLPGAWIMRTGFVAYGLGTLLAALSDWPPRSMVRGALALFGLGLIGAAIWSNAPILANLPADMHEDWLHSVASGIVGTAFAAACAARLFAPGGSKHDFLAWAGLIVSVAFPFAMGEFPELRGALQRAMFAVSFVFVAREFRAGEFKIFTRQ